MAVLATQSGRGLVSGGERALKAWGLVDGEIKAQALLRLKTDGVKVQREEGHRAEVRAEFSKFKMEAVLGDGQVW